MADTTERDGFLLKIQATVEFEFGSVCDFIKKLVESEVIPEKTGEAIKREIRHRGNNIIRIAGNHLEFVNVSRNHRAEPINTERVIGRTEKG